MKSDLTSSSNSSSKQNDLLITKSFSFGLWDQYIIQAYNKLSSKKITTLDQLFADIRLRKRFNIFRNTNEMLEHILFFMADFPAVTGKHIFDCYVAEHPEYAEFDNKKARGSKKAYMYQLLNHLALLGVLDKMVIHFIDDRDVSVWLAPFALPTDIDKVKHEYHDFSRVIIQKKAKLEGEQEQESQEVSQADYVLKNYVKHNKLSTNISAEGKKIYHCKTHKAPWDTCKDCNPELNKELEKKIKINLKNYF